jgi:hypothetical protein
VKDLNLIKIQYTLPASVYAFGIFTLFWLLQSLYGIKIHMPKIMHKSSRNIPELTGSKSDPWFSISSNTNGACETRKVLLSYMACNELFNWLKRDLTVLTISLYIHHIRSLACDGVSPNLPCRNISLCVVCDDQYLVFSKVYCILIKFRSFTCSSLLICCGMGDSGKPHHMEVTLCDEYILHNVHQPSFEDTNGLIRIRISRKNRQHNGQIKKVQKNTQRSSKRSQR